MIKDERQRAYKERLKQRGERIIEFKAHESLIDILDDFAASVRRTRTDVIRAILAKHLKKEGYDIPETYLLRKPKKDVL